MSFKTEEEYQNAIARVAFIGSQEYPEGHPTLDEKEELSKAIEDHERIKAEKLNPPKEAPKRIVTVGFGTAEQRDLELGEAILCRLPNPTRVVGIHQVKDGDNTPGYIIQLDTEVVNSSGIVSMQQQGLWIGQESLVAVLAVVDMFFNLTKKALGPNPEKLSIPNLMIKKLAERSDVEFQITDGINPETKKKTPLEMARETLEKAIDERAIDEREGPRDPLSLFNALGLDPKMLGKDSIYNDALRKIDQDTSLSATAKAVIKIALENKYKQDLDSEKYGRDEPTPLR